MIFKQFHESALGHVSCLVGSEETGEALVLDVRRDVDDYYDSARGQGLRIACAADTHRHNDYLTGITRLESRAPVEPGMWIWPVAACSTRQGPVVHGLAGTWTRSTPAPGETGQRACHDAHGMPIEASGSGQDGAIQAGRSWHRCANLADGEVSWEDALAASVEVFDRVNAVCWSSTTSMYQPDRAWAVYLDKGAVGVGQKQQGRSAPGRCATG